MTAAQRERVLEKHGKKAFACPRNAPGPGSYPLATPRKYPDRKRISSARAYYGRKDTTHCVGGRKRICRVARREGMIKKGARGERGWRAFCKGVR